MATRIRLTRMGTKQKPFYRVVVADQRKPRDGRAIDIVGRYDPRREPPMIEIDEAKALDWLGKGAQPSDAARSLLSKAGVLAKFDALKKGQLVEPSEPEAETEPEPEPEPEAETEAEGEATED